LLDGERDLVLLVVVGIAQIKLGSACAVQPLAEELIDIGVGGLFDGFGEIRGDDVFAAVGFEIALSWSDKTHHRRVDDAAYRGPSAFAIGVPVKFAGIVEVMTHNRLVPEILAFEPLTGGFPALIVGLVLAIARFAPNKFQERGESFVEPNVAPVLAGDEVSDHW